MAQTNLSHTGAHRNNQTHLSRTRTASDLNRTHQCHVLGTIHNPAGAFGKSVTCFFSWLSICLSFIVSIYKHHDLTLVMEKDNWLNNTFFQKSNGKRSGMSMTYPSPFKTGFDLWYIFALLMPFLHSSVWLHDLYVWAEGFHGCRPDKWDHRWSLGFYRLCRWIRKD